VDEWIPARSAGRESRLTPERALSNSSMESFSLPRGVQHSGKSSGTRRCPLWNLHLLEIRSAELLRRRFRLHTLLQL